MDLEYARRIKEGFVLDWKSRLEKAKLVFEGYEAAAGRKIAISEELVTEFLTKGMPPDWARRLDAHFRVWTRYALLYVRGKYKADSDKGRHDAYDFYQLKFLALPAMICTLDNRLRNIVKETGSWQAKYLLSPGEISKLVGS